MKSIIPLFCSLRKPVRYDSSVEMGILSTKSFTTIYHSFFKKKKKVYLPIIYPLYMHTNVIYITISSLENVLVFNSVLLFSFLNRTRKKRMEKRANPLGFSILKQSWDTQVKLGILWIWAKNCFYWLWKMEF